MCAFGAAPSAALTALPSNCKVRLQLHNSSLCRGSVIKSYAEKALPPLGAQILSKSYGRRYDFRMTSADCRSAGDRSSMVWDAMGASLIEAVSPEAAAAV